MNWLRIYGRFATFDESFELPNPIGGGDEEDVFLDNQRTEAGMHFKNVFFEGDETDYCSWVIEHLDLQQCEIKMLMVAGYNYSWIEDTLIVNSNIMSSSTELLEYSGLPGNCFFGSYLFNTRLYKGCSMQYVVNQCIMTGDEPSGGEYSSVLSDIYTFIGTDYYAIIENTLVENIHTFYG